MITDTKGTGHLLPDCDYPFQFMLQASMPVNGEPARFFAFTTISNETLAGNSERIEEIIRVKLEAMRMTILQAYKDASAA